MTSSNTREHSRSLGFSSVLADTHQTVSSTQYCSLHSLRHRSSCSCKIPSRCSTPQHNTADHVCLPGSNSSTTSPPPNTTTSNQNRTDYTADTSLLRLAITLWRCYYPTCEPRSCYSRSEQLSPSAGPCRLLLISQPAGLQHTQQSAPPTPTLAQPAPTPQVPGPTTNPCLSPY